MKYPSNIFYILLFFSFFPNFLAQNYTCDPSCATCSGPSTSQCLTCQYKFYIQNGACVLLADFLSDMTSQLKVTNDFYLFWTYNTNSTITMVFRWKENGYIAIGFGTSMKGIDVISAEKVNSQITINDRWSKNHNTPPYDIDLGGTDDLTPYNYLYRDPQGFAMIKFNRKLNTGDRYDYVIHQETVTFSFAYADSSTISFHGSNYYLFKFDFIEGEYGTAEIISTLSPLIQAHGIGLLICWSFLVDIGIIIVRYFKFWKHYLDIHGLIFILVDFYTLIIVFIVIGKNSNDLPSKFESDSMITAHFALGVIVVTLLTFQHIGGIIYKKTLESKKVTMFTSLLGNLKKGHQILGFAIYLITKATVLVGILVYGDFPLFIGFVVYYGVLFIFRIVIEIVYRKGRSKNIVETVGDGKMKEGFKELINDLEEKKIPTALLVKKYPQLRWCLLNNSIYDLKKFEHPGGNYIIEEIIGREIGRFFYGAYALENSKTKAYNHTGYAKQIFDQMKAGELGLENINILQKTPAKDVNHIWALAKKTKLTESVSKIEFFSGAHTVKNHVDGVEWFGRHFTVTSTKPHHKLRLYTTVLCFTDENIEFRKNLLDFFNQKMNQSSNIPPKKLEVPVSFSQNLPLIIKKYAFPNTLSEEIHNANPNDKFEIQGPLGPGLELTANSNGDHIIFSGGTGILPFVDLLDFLLKKSIYHVLQTMFGRDIVQEANVFKQDFENIFGDKFKVILFAAFQSKEEIDYLDFILTLYKINKKYNLNYFDMILRFNDKSTIEGAATTNSYFDAKFIKENVIVDHCSKIFVCGNPKMNKEIPEICIKNQIEKEKICLV